MQFHDEDGYSSADIELPLNLMVVFLILFFIAYTSEQKAIKANFGLTADVDRFRRSNNKLKGDNKDLSNKNKDLTGKNKELSDENEDLNKDVQNYKSKWEGLVGVKEEYDAMAKEYAEHQARSKQLIGLSGRFHNVVWVIDFSGSINETQQLSNYLEEINLQIGTLTYEQFQIITFYGDKEDGTKPYVSQWKPDWQDANDATKAAAMAYVSQHPAQGATPLKAALAKALALPNVDTIVIFTDGQPTDGGREDILEFVRLNNVNAATINSVAFGNYFGQEWGPFLYDLAHEHGGEFIGR